MRGVRNEYFYLDYDNLRWWSRNSFLCLSGTGNAGTSGMEDLPEGKIFMKTMIFFESEM